ncbi:MAG: hypothetical protein A2Y00_05375 [Omnitrophica WOR_2 bacterium GWF2_43_52]|nr:MAG: hypothetical protein A2062_05790 [Omnitrophica WOR_2 bacterium GWA2_44_7]OGX14449.1 MAG: hypothetical protein A2Y01_02120 [Omnitrophica WOR_2 bacterium GWC2_44_8]OGX20530.1 MAG: hypothetical protein A2Y00_05375 [Omnitrophica WOR_2 bacterium GWF2_43_52]
MVDNHLDAGPVEVFAGISVIIHYAFVADLGKIVPKSVEHVFAMMGLGIKGREVALGLVVGGTARINHISFLFGFFVWRYHKSSLFYNNPYNKTLHKSSDINGVFRA